MTAKEALDWVAVHQAELSYDDGVWHVHVPLAWWNERAWGHACGDASGSTLDIAIAELERGWAEAELADAPTVPVSSWVRSHHFEGMYGLIPAGMGGLISGQETAPARWIICGTANVGGVRIHVSAEGASTGEMLRSLPQG